MIRRQVQLTDDQDARLRKLAAERKVSQSDLVRQAVDLLLRQAEGDSAEARRRRALDVVGRFSSGRSDVSIRHDDYLAEEFR
ncbi:MAG: CopG family transcriptional regulator [Armatimonadota bacterium]|nr:CopG family transcriptional regulator [Armatimonadota bacterium]MDR7448133.1 CopG family transcriptional regulator [Armatimonadota bacterium]MDR7460441.1 CopG family transcriptional regulator [Armatimonadota bacterium]MDR7478256.1 CopG family transcriptional regulator [Armatimonadota bacterium]MDR7488869.1 CopG family transcriptional regulator [Armatimonadota bacterium]